MPEVEQWSAVDSSLRILESAHGSRRRNFLDNGKHQRQLHVSRLPLSAPVIWDSSVFCPLSLSHSVNGNTSWGASQGYGYRKGIVMVGRESNDLIDGKGVALLDLEEPV